MDMEQQNGKMGANMKETSKMENFMEKENILGKMAAFIWALIKMVSDTESENYF